MKETAAEKPANEHFKPTLRFQGTYRHQLSDGTSEDEEGTMISNGTITSYTDFLALFPERPRTRAGDGWLVICPAHADHIPSLWITPSKNPDFVADFKCHAGCENAAVLKAKNLTWADIRQNGHGGGGDSIKMIRAT
jgi:hypothetical protein